MSDAEIEGWSDLIDWFGHSPSFHDAEVVSVELRREPEPSVLRVHAWRTNEDLDANGFFRLDRHATVTFTINGITALRLDTWNHQNVLAELWVTSAENGYTLHMPSSYGMEGEISAKAISVTVEPRVA
jgi:hypothetical protein